jgi:hypothetical protein
MPDELAAQLPYSQAGCRGLGLVRLEKEGYEADDILGTLARIAKENRCECVNVTGDRDSFQLVGDGTTVHLATTNETKIFDEQAVIDTYGVRPAQLIDVKAIMGDTSDNITGVPGIGEKGALKLIAEYGSLEGVYNNIDNIKGAVKDKLIAGKDSAMMSRYLAEICTKVPISENLEDYRYKGKDRPALIELFTKLEFKQFIDRFDLEKTEAVHEKPEFTDSDTKTLAEMAEKNRIYLHIKDNVIFATDGTRYIAVPFDASEKAFSKTRKTHLRWSVKDLYISCAQRQSLNAGRRPFVIGYVLSPPTTAFRLRKLALMYLIGSEGNHVSLYRKLFKIMLEKRKATSRTTFTGTLTAARFVLAKMEASALP